jgi:integrase/recombinase XerD
LLLLSRLGLRACELAALQLEDLDWRSGQVTIRGKGKALARLPRTSARRWSDVHGG